MSSAAVLGPVMQLAIWSGGSRGPMIHCRNNDSQVIHSKIVLLLSKALTLCSEGLWQLGASDT